jgi:hypothetical protein
MRLSLFEVIHLDCHLHYMSMIMWTFTAIDELPALNKRQ